MKFGFWLINKMSEYDLAWNQFNELCLSFTPPKIDTGVQSVYYNNNGTTSQYTAVHLSKTRDAFYAKIVIFYLQNHAE